MFDFLSAIPTLTGYFVPAIVGGFASLFVYKYIAPKEVEGMVKVWDEDKEKYKEKKGKVKKPSSTSLFWAVVTFLAGIGASMAYIDLLDPNEMQKLYNLVGDDLGLKSFNEGTRALIGFGYALLGRFAIEVVSGLFTALSKGIGHIFSLKFWFIIGGLVLAWALISGHYWMMSEADQDSILAYTLIALIALGFYFHFKGKDSKGGGHHS